MIDYRSSISTKRGTVSVVYPTDHGSDDNQNSQKHSSVTASSIGKLSISLPVRHQVSSLSQRTSVHAKTVVCTYMNNCRKGFHNQS